MTKKLFTEYFFLFILGAFTSLSLPPFNYWIINFFTFSVFFIFLFKRSFINEKIKFFFIYGWLFGFGYFLTNLYWIPISLTFDDSLKIFIPFAIILVPAFLAIFFGLITILFIIFKSKNYVISFLIFSLIFGILEFLRGILLTGFPWNLIVYSFSNQLEILSILSFIGTYGLNLICISLFVSPALFYLSNSKKDTLASFFFIIIYLFFYTYGTLYKTNFDNLPEKKK